MASAAARQLSTSEISLRLQQQELVAEFGRFALSTDDFLAILDEASLVAARGLEARFAKVLEYLPGEMGFVMRSGVGWNPGLVGHARLGGDLMSPAGYAFRTGKPIISNHLASEQRFRTPKLLEEHGVRSAINVLIAARDAAPFGVLEGDSTQRGEFGDHDVAFLQALANTLAVAVEAQRRQDGLAQLLAEKEALIQANEVLLREKDLLMQEVHHRVTNSLQLVRSILLLQTRLPSGAEAKEQIAEAAGRVMTVGALHRRLYESGSVVAADARDYLNGVLGDMRAVLPDLADDRAMTLAMESFSLPADDITPLGLITGELLTNAIKHGRGRIDVEVSRNAEGLEIRVSDEGPGFPADFNFSAARGFGMRLVSALAKGRGEAMIIDRSVPFGRMIVRTSFGGLQPG